MRIGRTGMVLLLVALVLLSGCAADSGGTATVSPTPEPDSPIQSPGDRTASSEAPNITSETTSTDRGPQTGSQWTVTITRIIDGDTVEAEFPNGEVDTLRLLGVDTPETTLSRVSPGEFEGIPDSTAGRDHLFNWGERATTFATTELKNQTVRIEVDQEADRRGSFGRLLVYIYSDEENFNERLLAEGYARVYESQFSKLDSFLSVEETAQSNNIGLWNYTGATLTPTSTADPAEGPLTVSTIHEDAMGTERENLDDEYIEFTNTGESMLNLTGWTVQDEADHTYRFPDGFTLEPGSVVTLYTGSGTDTDTELYWGSDSPIWNNNGDTITVKDDAGDIVISEEYS